MRYLLPLQYIDAVARTGSIRKAAEQLAITSTALNRRILAMEEELGVSLFERLPRGVRLSTAGEMFIHHARSQMAEMDRLRSRIADLSGVRRGHVSIGCSQALLPYFMPRHVAAYRQNHPAVTFSTRVHNREAAVTALVEFETDIELIFEPLQVPEFKPLMMIEQQIQAVMAADHPLAGSQRLRLSHLQEYPLAMPTAANGVRYLIDAALMRSGQTLQPTIESDSFDFLRHYVMHEHCITFQIPLGLPQTTDQSIVIKPLDRRDVPSGKLFVSQLRGRNLPVAAARFANDIINDLRETYGDESDPY